jgi:ribose transport system substrate-binding protein
MRQFTTKALVLVAATALSLTAACSSSTATPGASGSAAGGQKYIAIISKGFQHQFWQAVKKGADDEAAKEGVKVTFEGPASESEVEAQLTMLENAIAKKPDAIAFAALDTKAASGALDKIKSQNIPLVAFDSGVDSDAPLTTVATDNIAAAGEAAKHMCALIGNVGKVGVIVHDQTSRTGIDRRDGFLKGMKDTCPNVTVLPVQYGAGDQAKSADIAKSIIQANPDIKGFFGANEGSAVGVVKAVQELNKTGLAVIGFDSGKAQKDAITAGIMSGAVTQDPIGMGAATVKAAVDAINKKSVDKKISSGYYWFDKTNMADPKIAAVLYD